MKRRILLVICIAYATLFTASPTANADIVGFNNLAGWTYNTSDSGVPPAVGSNFVELTTGGSGQNRNIWFNVPQDINTFTAEFTYRASNIGTVSARHGIAFVVHNDSAGLNTLSTPFNSTGFGFRNISPSAGVTIELDTGLARTFTGFYRNGVVGGGSENIFPINAFSLQEIDVSIVYDGSLLSVSLDDGINSPFSRNYLVSPSFAGAFGSTNALVGFGATTGPQSGVRQFLSDFRFTSTAIPEPSSGFLAIGGTALILMRRHRRK